MLLAAVLIMMGTLTASSAAETPVQVSLSSPSRYVYPVLADSDESISYNFYLNRAANVTAIVRDSGGTSVRTLLTGVSLSSGTRYYDWDFRDAAGQPVDDGAYSIDITATASDATTSTVTLSTGIDRRGKPVITGVGDNAEASGTLFLAFDPPEDLPVTSVRFRAGPSAPHNYCVDSGATTADESGTFQDDLEIDSCGAGPREVWAQLSWKDPLGVSQGGWTRAVPVTVVDAVAPMVTAPEPVTVYRSSPDQWSYGVPHFRWVDSSGLSVRKYWVTDEAGNTVVAETSFSYSDCSSTYWRDCYFYFYGTDDAGAQLAAGVYTVHTVFTDKAGNTTEDVTATITLDDTTPGKLTTPTNGGTLVGTAPFEFTPTTDPDVTVTQVRVRVGDQNVYIYNPSPDGIWRTTFPVGTLPAGPTTLTTTTSWRDADGRTTSYTSGEWTVGVDPTSIPLDIELTPDSGTAPVESAVKVTTSHPNSEQLNVTINWGDGTPLERHTLAAPYDPPTYQHTFDKPGDHELVVTVGDAGGTFASKSAGISVAGAVNEPPTASAQLGAETVLAGEDAVLSFSASDPEGAAMTYRVDFGDGSAPVTGDYSEPLVLAHTYSVPDWYVVRAQVSDGHNTISRTLRAHVLIPEPLVARAGDDLRVPTGDQVTLDASASRPLGLITKYEWRLDGNVIGTAPQLTRSFGQDGKRTIQLTVRSGDQSATDNVVVETFTPPPASGFEITITSGGSAVSGAQAVVIQPDGTRLSSVSDGDGKALVTGLGDAGSVTAYVEAAGYRPAAVTGTLVDGRAEAEVALDAGAAGAVTVEHRPLTYEEIIDAGIDPDAPENQHVYEATLNLYFEPEPDETIPPPREDPPQVRVTGTKVICFVNCEPADWSGSGSGCEPSCDRIISGGAEWRPTVQYVEDKPVIQWLVIPMRATFLKEFFDVSMVVQNLTTSELTFQGGAGSITLPDGLSLAPTATPQTPTVDLADIPGGQSRQATWIVRGDVEGEYPLSVDYLATIEPLGTPIHLEGRTETPLKVWGGSALETVIKVDDTATRWGPFNIDVEVKNISPVPVYNFSFELLERPADAPEWQAPYLFAPMPPRKQQTGEIKPNSTFTASYTLFPGLGNDDVQVLKTKLGQSFVQKTGGDVDLAPELDVRDAETTKLSSGTVETTVYDAVAVVRWPRTRVLESVEPVTVTGYQLWATQSLESNDWFLVSDQEATDADLQMFHLTAARRSVGRYFAVATELSDGSVRFVHTLGEGPPRYVALGDSYSSGEGVPIFETGTASDLPLGSPSGEGNICHRSKQGSYSRVLSNQSGRGGQLLPAGYHACSGSIAAWMDTPNDDNEGEERQLDHLNAFTDVVTLTMGGNDIGFGDIAKSCLLWKCDWGLAGQEVLGSQAWLNAGADYFEGVRLAKDLVEGVVECVDPKDLVGKVKCVWKRDLDERADQFLKYAMYPEWRATPRNLHNGVLRQRLRDSYVAALETAPNARVLVAGYPQLVTDGGAGSCELFPDLVEGAGLFELTQPERVAVSRVVDELNNVIGGVIHDLRSQGRKRIEYVDPTAADSPFAGHELCQGGTLNPATYFNSIVDPDLNGYLNPANAGPKAYSLHPNADGQAAYAELFAAALDTQLGTSVRAQPGAQVDAGEVLVAANATSARFETSWSGSTVTMRLRNPAGDLVDLGAANVSTGGTETSQWVEVTDPMAGTWQVALFGDDVPEGGEPTDLRTFVDVPDPAPIEATASATRGDANTFAFTASAPGVGEGATFEWTFSDGGRATGATVEHAFTRTVDRSAVVEVSDGTRSTYVDVQLDDDPEAPALTAANPPVTSKVGVLYEYAFKATGVPTPTFSVKEGSLPAGLSLSNEGVLSGKPTAPGASTFVVRATNASGTSDSGELTITVAAEETPEPDPEPDPTTTPTPTPVPTPTTEPTPVPPGFTGAGDDDVPAADEPVSVRIRNAGRVRPSGDRKVFAKFVIVLSGPSAEKVTVRFKTVNDSAKAPSDYARVRRTVTFKPGQTRRVVKIRIKANRPGEKVETFLARLSEANGATIARAAGRAVIKRS